MTPEEYLAQIGKLIAAGKDQEALDFSAEHHAGIASSLTDEQLHRADGMLEGAAMAVSLETWATASPATTADEAAEPRREL